MLGTILFILGIVFIFLAYVNLERLKEKGLYDKDVDLIDILRRPNTGYFFHAIFFPWAYFKPWKVKEGWIIIMTTAILLIIGIYLMIVGIRYN